MLMNMHVSGAQPKAIVVKVQALKARIELQVVKAYSMSGFRVAPTIVMPSVCKAL